MREAIRLFMVGAAVVAVAFGYVHLLENKGYPLKPGTPAPPFKLPALSGGEVELGSFKGRLVVVNFWATWCAPCVEEMPSLERLHRALAGEGLVVLGISVDEDETALRRFVSAHGVTFPVLRDPGGRLAAGLYRATGYPETFVLDRAGFLRAQYVGPAEWSTPEALDHFRGLLKPAAAS
jgi:cytochrome c biogenesis protein CcmG/thiol:disulfide interchange protein DsbE